MSTDSPKRASVYRKVPNEEERRAIARTRLLERVHFGLYCANVVEIAVLIIAIGGRWWALTAPILVAFGPRYGTIGEIVVARAVFTVLLGIGAIAAVVTGR